MRSSQIIEAVKKAFENQIEEINADIAQPFIRVQKGVIRELLNFLKTQEGLNFDFLRCLTGIDLKDRLETVYHLFSYKHKHEIVIKTDVLKSNPQMDSVCDIYGIANWYERETFDLLGIVFKGHPDLRRIMLPDDWDGHPLRKDYVYPTEYRGIKHER